MAQIIFLVKGAGLDIKSLPTFDFVNAISQAVCFELLYLLKKILFIFGCAGSVLPHRVSLVGAHRFLTAEAFLVAEHRL